MTATKTMTAPVNPLDVLLAAVRSNPAVMTELLAKLATVPVPTAPTAVATQAPQGETVDSLSRLSVADLTRKLTDRFGKAPPASWNRVKMANAYLGTSATPAGSYGKLCLTWNYTQKAKVAPAKTWNTAKLAAEAAKDTPTLPRSKGSKDTATVAYVRATGYLPAKSWKVEVIVAKTTTKTAPARNGIPATVDADGKVVVSAMGTIAKPQG